MKIAKAVVYSGNQVVAEFGPSEFFDPIKLLAAGYEVEYETGEGLRYVLNGSSD